MKSIVKITLLLSIICKISIAQYNQIPTSPCHLTPFYCPYKYQSYLASNSNRIYLYESLKCTPSSSNGYMISYSDNDNTSCTTFVNYYSGDPSYGTASRAILCDTNIIISEVGMMGFVVKRISNQGMITQYMSIPSFSSPNISATNENMYAITQHYSSNNTLIFVKNVNNINQFGTLNYANIKSLPTPKLYFANDSIGYIFGKDTLNNNILLRSTDYGDNWSLAFYPINGIADIQFAGDTGIAVGNHGTVYKTIDNGLTWSTTPSFTSKNLSSVSIGSNEIYVAGDSAALFKSIDLGATWTSEALSITDKIIWVKVTDFGSVYFEAQAIINNHAINSVYKKNYFTSVKELKNDIGSLTIYPNPASNSITIQIDEKLKEKFLISIINSLGETVLESDKPEIKLSGISSGLYSVELKTTEGEIFRSKVVKIN